MKKVVLYFLLFINLCFAGSKPPEALYSNHTYLVTFKSLDPQYQSIKGLLDHLHQHMGRSKVTFNSTHHFRTAPNGSSLIGTIGVNAEMGIEKFTTSLKNSEVIEVIKVHKPSLEEFLAHTKRKQIALSQTSTNSNLETIKSDFLNASNELQIPIHNLEIDHSDAPLILYGKATFNQTPPANLKTICEKLPNKYTYSGSSSNLSYFAICITPYSPQKREKLISRIKNLYHKAKTSF